MRTAPRQAIGALIWLHHDRPDVGWDITKLATEAAGSRKEAPKALETIAGYNKTAKFSQN